MAAWGAGSSLRAGSGLQQKGLATSFQVPWQGTVSVWWKHGFWILMTWTWILHLPWLSLSLWASHCTPLSFHFLQHKTKIIIQQIEFWRLSETMHVVFSSLALGNTQKVQLLWVNLGNIADWWRSYFQSFGNHASERIWRIRSMRGGEKGDKIQLKPEQNELCSLVVL